jgi:putative cell wall-binding protein
MPIDNGSQTPDISADGRWVAFGSFASVLVEGDRNGEQDIFLYDRQSGTTRRASVKSDGNEVLYASAYPTVSDDGQRVTFDTRGGFTANDNNAEYDCYVHDFASSETTLVSQTPGGVAGNSYSGSAKISADGDSVAFYSWASNIIVGDTNAVSDIFVRDLTTGQTVRASVANDGAEANNYSWSPSISGDGSKVAFGSAATNLVAGDTNGHDDIYVRDLVAGTTVRASLAHDGAQPNAACGPTVISDDGRYVAFESDATNLVAGGTDGTRHIFLRDLQANTTELISQSSAGVEANQSCYDAFISADGGYVVFATDAGNLVAGEGNGAYDVFLRDRSAGTTTRVSVASGGEEADAGCYSPAISADGEIVAFHSDATNLGAETDGWTAHVYVRDIGEDITSSIISSGVYTMMGNGYSAGASIAMDGSAVAYHSSANNLVAGDAPAHSEIFVTALDGGGTKLASKGVGGVPVDGDSWNSSLSANGSTVAFTSGATNLVADDTNDSADVFVADVDSGVAERVSVSWEGEQADSYSESPHLSANGRRITFLSDATNLVLGDTNSMQDAFVRDVDTGETIRVSVSSGGDQPDDHAWGPRISGDGRYVTFHSYASNLVASDGNDANDVFVHDIVTGETIRASLGEGGVQLDGNSEYGSLSYDGRLLAFHSRATNAVVGVSDGRSHIYVRDLDTGDITLVSKHTDGTPGNGNSFNPVVSVDGRYVAFMSLAQNLIDGYMHSNYHVFVHDLQTGETVLLDTAPGGPQANAASFGPSLSGDGSLAAFETAASNLHAQDNNNETDVYVARLGSLVPVDTKAPETTPYGVPASWVSEDVTVTLEATDTPAPDEYASGVAGIRYSIGGSVVATYTEPIVVTEEGTTLIEYSAIDNVGNAEETQTATVRIDKTAPTVGDNAPAGWSKTNVSVTLTANDAGSDVAAILYDMGSGEVTYTAPIAVTAEGVTNIAYRAVDNAGLSSDGGEATVRIDKTAPVTASNARELYYGPASITLTPSDGLSGVAQTRWTLDGGAQNTGTTVNVASYGHHTLAYWSVDGAGNAETPWGATFMVLSAGRTDVAGTNRFTTGVEASKRAFPGGASTVVLATGRNWPDALGGSALAGAVDGPLLLVDTNSVSTAVLAEISRLGATKAYILGGEAAVSNAVKTQLEGALGAGKVVRLAGNTRYATALAVADEAIRLEGSEFGGDAFVVTGENFPDALGASPISSAGVRPILLAKPDAMPSMPPQVRRVVILGGTSAVSGVTEAALKSTLGNVNVDRKGGRDRFETAALVAEYGITQGLGWDGVGLATGEDFPDALAGGAMLGSLNTVMLLTRGSSLHTQARTRLQANAAAITTWHYIGGTGVLSDTVRNEVDNLLK